ncbi:class I adenylate-forming enzyme family protein [Achromobacter aloeverae]|uniref:Long-chain fatty acid--CoA ligase n=1 Tax=Achromobacter aloeverae TaxID=1750518 RepID=A0A4Q1HGA2_9BURK|nr:AMP-binding protein [Achromobacter aloeverae]RXN85194.1 long-chain fatty acid--CoA ligase [Achromobacter aloeverae]
MYPIDFFFRAAQRYPGNTALDGPAGVVTYADLAARVRALAAAMQGLDPAPGTRVAICAGNTVEHVLALLATLAAGKTWVPLNYRSTPMEIGRILAATEPSIVVIDAAGAPLVDGACAAHRIRLDAEADAAPPGASAYDLPALLDRYAGAAPVAYPMDREAIQAIKFTGGTTGLPKGVMQPARAWNAGIINQVHGWSLGPEDRYVVAAPITHGTGTYILPLLAQGGALLLVGASSPATITAAFRERGGTLSFMPPTLIYMIMAQEGVTRADFPRLRHLIYGGAPMPVGKFEQARAFFGPVLGTTYGQTEAPQIVTLMRPADFEDAANLGSVGRVTWLSDLAILDADGRPCAAGEIGEVAVRGDLVMAGYWRLPEKTAETVVDGWLRTGDTGLVDERGYLFLKDRLRDVVITGGFNVYPVDVENALISHPDVYECTVFGVPDDKWGEAVHAAVQPNAGVAIDIEALKLHVRGLLGPVHTPKHIHIYQSLPRSSVGKVLKNAVRDAALKEIA